MNLHIDVSDANDFVDAWIRTLKQLPGILSKDYNFKRDALVFSFDSEWKPFLGYTIGYNRHIERRKYFERIPSLMSDIAWLMFSYRGKSGRVFINNELAYFVDDSRNEWSLCTIGWPKGVHVVNQLGGYLRSHTPLTIEAPGRQLRWTR